MDKAKFRRDIMTMRAAKKRKERAKERQTANDHIGVIVDYLEKNRRRCNLKDNVNGIY